MLLAGPTEDTVVEDTTGDDWEADRRALEARELSFTDVPRAARAAAAHRPAAAVGLLGDAGLRAAALRHPVLRGRSCPTGQVTRDVSTESDQVVWLPVREAIDAVDDGTMAMLPPTYCTCLELYDSAAAAEALAARRRPGPHAGRAGGAASTSEGAYLSIPDRLVRARGGRRAPGCGG